MSSRLRLSLAAAVTLAATAAEAHPGAAHVHSLADGLLHPLTGADHLLAMVAVGLIAARARGTAAVAVPAAFVGAMALGAALGMAGLAAGAAEIGIALSLLVLGAFAAVSRPLPTVAAAGTAALAGIVHGVAHGAEAPLDGATGGFILGMLAATAALHAAGFLAGRVGRGRWVGMATGLAAIAVGAAGLAGAL